jgi:hypothetical protein
VRILLVVAITVTAGTASAEPAADCATEATMLRTHLTAEARSARIWNTAWAIGFGAAAAGQLALALTSTKPLGEFDTDYKETMYVGAAKATIGMGARIVIPLRIAVPSAQSDACADVVALRASVAKGGRREKRTVFLTIIGGTLVNLAGSLLLWQRRDFETGALSFAMGVPISPISAYTQPRRSWRLWRESETTWTAGVGGVAGSPRSLWLTGTF